MSFFDYNTACKYLALIERNIDVNKYQVGSIHVWPIVRVTLSNLLSNSGDISQTENNRHKEPILNFIELVNQKFETLGVSNGTQDQRKDNPAYNVEKKTNISSKGSSIVCFVGAIDDNNLRLENGWYCSIIDSWYHLASSKFPCLKMEIFQGQSNIDIAPRIYPPFLVYPQFDIQHREDIMLLNELKKEIKSLVASINHYNHTSFGITFETGPCLTQSITCLESAMLIKNCVKPYLRDFRPNSVLMSNSYYYLGFGVHWAASELGIIGVELQHGANGDVHAAYTHKISLPKSGYAICPKIVSVWGNGSAKSIKKWYPKGHSHHEVIVGGKATIPKVFSQQMAEIEQPLLKQKTEIFDKVILVSLQPYRDIGLTKQLLLSMMNAPPSWFWLIRCHPLAERPGRSGLWIDQVNEVMNSLPFTRYEADLATKLPLEIVLPLCTNHVTHFSSVFIEALAFGISTTFIHELGNLYKRFIDKGLAFMATDHQEILNSISTSNRHNIDSEMIKYEIDTDISIQLEFLDSFG